MPSVLSGNCASPGFHSNMSSGFSTSHRSPSLSQSQPPSPSPSPPPTIHNRRTLSSRTASDNHSSRRSQPPPTLPGLGLPASPFAAANNNITNTHSNLGEENSHPNSRSAAAPIFVPQRWESDAECWEKMVALQRDYHCYNSARLEAAVEALERGCMIEEVPMPSRFCLDLLNEGLQAQIESESESW